jgi:hypothetical protein
MKKAPCPRKDVPYKQVSERLQVSRAIEVVVNLRPGGMPNPIEWLHGRKNNGSSAEIKQGVIGGVNQGADVKQSSRKVLQRPRLV